MSHFTVLVVTDQQPTKEVLEKALMPYHEFECTGEEQYIQEIDETAEYLKKYTKREDENKDLAFPQYLEKWHEIECVPFGSVVDIRGDHQFAYATLNEQGHVLKVVRRTNPNAKWDWYTVGGRWPCMLLQKGESKGCNQCKYGDLDLPNMKKRAIQSRVDLAKDNAEKCGMTIEEYQTASQQSDEAHKAWLELPPSGRVRGQEHNDWCLENGWTLYCKTLGKVWDLPKLEGRTMEEWWNAAPVLSTFAVLLNGQWYEKGEMGWWGMVTDEKEEKHWMVEYQDVLDSIRPEQWISIVDCHI